jgi:hypothetical protein
MALRVLGECLPSEEARAAYQRALDLSEPVTYDTLACEIALLRWANPSDRHTRWEGLADRLIEAGLGAWLFECDENHLPRLVVCI